MRRLLIVLALLSTPAIAQITPPQCIGSHCSGQADLEIGNTGIITSAKPVVVENKAIALSGSDHGFASNNALTYSGANQGWASFDCRDRVYGSDADHVVCFQKGLKITLAGTINNIYGDWSQIELWGGHANFAYPGGVDNGVALHGGTIGTQIARWCPVLTAGSDANWCYWADSPVHVPYLDVKGPPGELARFATAAPASGDRWITIGAQDLDTEGFRLGYNGNSGNGYFQCLYVTCKVEIRSNNGILLAGLRPAPTGSKALCFKDGEAFVSPYRFCP